MGVYIPNMEKPKSCWECFNADCDHWGEHGYDNSADCPLIDIVTCGECKYWHEGRCWNMKGLNKTDGVVNADDFCSYGKKNIKTKNLDLYTPN